MTDVAQTRQLLCALRSMPMPAEGYRARCVAGGSYVGLDAHDRFALFLPAQDRRGACSMRAGAITLTMGVSCTLCVNESEVVRSRFHVLQCESHDPSTLETFCHALDALLGQEHVDQIDPDKLAALFQSLIALLGIKPAADLAHARQGLWGELLAMEHMGGIRRWVRPWHRDPYQQFDFTHGQLQIEVKSTCGPARAHTFAHRQLCPAQGEKIAVLSLLLVVDDAGTTLQSLIQQARGELGAQPEELIKLEAAVRRAGMSGSSVPGPAFDHAAAHERVLWFWVQQVPRFLESEPVGVSQTHYVVDLTRTVPLDELEVDRWLSEWL